MLGKMTPLKIDTCNVNSLKFRSMRLEDSLSDTNPLIQKQKNKTQALIKNTKPLIHKQKKKRNKKSKP